VQQRTCTPPLSRAILTCAAQPISALAGHSVPAPVPDRSQLLL